MAGTVSAETIKPPATIAEALDMVKAWENGGLSSFSPEGLALALALQRARVSREVTTTIGLAEAVA